VDCQTFSRPMGKEKRHGVCVFCGAVAEVTDEHVFPEAWYPDDTPPDVWKWQVPSCYACNHEKYGKRESRIFPFLGMTAETDHAGAKGIGERAFRAADESLGKKPKDKKSRARVRELMKERAQVIRPDEVPEGADHLGWRHQATSLLSTYVHESDMLPVIGKIARGVIYIDSGRRVEDDYSVKVWRELSKVPAVFLGMTANVTYSCGPGIVVDMVRVADHYPPMCFMRFAYGAIRTSGMPRSFRKVPRKFSKPATPTQNDTGDIKHASA
jgi:hypothetical protein